MYEFIRLGALCAMLSAVVFGFYFANRAAERAIERGRGSTAAMLIAVALVVLVAGLFTADPAGTIDAINDLVEP